MIYQHDFAPCLIIVTSYMDHGGISSGSFWSYIWVNVDALNAPKKVPTVGHKAPRMPKKVPKCANSVPKDIPMLPKKQKNTKRLHK